MSAEVFIVQHAVDLRRFIAWCGRLTFERGWKISVERLTPRARVDQEAVLRGKERQISEFTGQDPDDIHERMLVLHYGTDRVEVGNGQIWERPARRTRTGPNPLNEDEMRDHIRYVESFAASELGMSLR